MLGEEGNASDAMSWDGPDGAAGAGHGDADSVVLRGDAEADVTDGYADLRVDSCHEEAADPDSSAVLAEVPKVDCQCTILTAAAPGTRVTRAEDVLTGYLSKCGATAQGEGNGATGRDVFPGPHPGRTATQPPPAAAGGTDATDAGSSGGPSAAASWERLGARRSALAAAEHSEAGIAAVAPATADMLDTEEGAQVQRGAATPASGAELPRQEGGEDGVAAEEGLWPTTAYEEWLRARLRYALWRSHVACCSMLHGMPGGPAAEEGEAAKAAEAPAAAAMLLDAEEGEEGRQAMAPPASGAAASGGGGGELLFDDLRAALASVSSSLGRGSAPFAACACDPGQHGEARPSSDPVRTPQPPQPAAALELLSPVTCCSGSSADLAAVQRQGAACAAAASAAAPSPRPLPSVAAEVQTQHPAAAADNEPADGTTPQRSAKEVTPQQPNAQQRGVAPVRLLPRVDRLPRIAMTPNAKLWQHNARYNTAAKAVVDIVLGVVATAEEQQGSDLGPCFYLTATAVLLLSLVLLHGLEDPSTQPWLKRGTQNMEELVAQLERWASFKDLNLDTCIRYLWAGAPDWPKVAQTLAAVREGLTLNHICKGSYNAVFWVVGRGDLLTRQPLHNIDSDLLAAVYNQGPALLRHLRAACAIHRDSKQPIGVRVMGLLPVVNRRVPDLTTGEALRSLCAAKGKVAIAMVLERLTTVEEVAKALAAYTVARGPWQEGVWPLGLGLALTRGVLSATGHLIKLGLHHGDIKVNNVGFTDLKQQPFRDATFLDNDDLSQDPNGRVHRYHTSRFTALGAQQCINSGNMWCRPSLRLQGMDLHQVQGFQATLIVLLLPEAVLYHANDGCVNFFSFVPALWNTGHGGLGVLYPSQLMSAVLAGVLGTLMHPLADKRKGLPELMPRVHSLCSAMDECDFCLRGLTDAGGCLRVPIGAGPLAHLCSPPQTDVLLRQLLSALEEWREDPFMAANLFQVITLLHKAAHCTWPAGPVNDFMQRVLLLAVLCDIVRVERQAEAGLERPELLLLYKGKQGDRERTLLHLLGATGSTQGYLTILRALAMAGLCFDRYKRVMNAVDQNGYSPLMLAAVHGQHALVMAHISFAKEQLDEEAQQLLNEALSPDLRKVSERAVLQLLDGLVPQPAALGGLLTILCSQFNGHNDQLQKLLAYVPPVLRLPEVTGGQGGGASSSGAGGEVAAGGLLAAAHAHLGASQEKLEQALEDSRLQPLLRCLRGPVQPAAGQEAGPHIVEQVARGALKLFATAAELPLTDAVVNIGVYVLPARLLTAKTARELGADTPFHAAAAMAGPLPGLYAAVEETFGCKLADKCLAELNADGRTPLQVLLQCHPVLMSAPSRAFGKVDDHRTEEGRAKLAAIAVGLRDFMAERVKDSATQSLQAELGMAVPNLLPGCWS
ncbi:hypothetical protein CHLRE_14g620250v5 [Chlamydomonas reinhardtii]|uniref:Protein kinase domain-containing protein n=1 Tax=Chlamydomonas reinhardtii TaxID=3055 RepID=A0A2K3CXY1_CHLRE|nr:uncharacterized protein CHLRE_14g620250v5 [Chlamydomonas reinhardtii]PNW73141.1 hypothetical protein CHLRE_14g620250v5 [Chlamydomonas reinhardtii]